MNVDRPEWPSFVVRLGHDVVMDPEGGDGELLGALEVARLAGVHDKTVARWARTGRLPVAALTPAGHRKYRSEDVAAFLGTFEHPKPTPQDRGEGVGDDDGLIGGELAAQLAGVSTNTVRRWVARGILTPARVTVAGNRRYRREDVLAAAATRARPDVVPFETVRDVRPQPGPRVVDDSPPVWAVRAGKVW